MLSSIDTGTGPPVVLLHGQPGTGASWDPVIQLLETGHRVLAPDRIGYGSSAGEAQGFTGNADLIASFIEERRAGPATVVAHSWAGGAAVLLAHRHPRAVSNLILVGAACTPDSLDAIDRLLILPGVGNALTTAGLIAIDSVLPRMRSWLRYVPIRYRDRIGTSLPSEPGLVGVRASNGGFARQKRSFMTEQRALGDEMPAVTAALAELEVPVVVVCGAWDLVVRPSAAVSLARAISGSELISFPRSGHFVARDAPEELAEVIRARAGVRPGPPLE
jgi:pimeloyl-ACP methyl ester carboxylesterase